MTRVLVVDDQPVNVQVVGAMLGKLGCEVVPAFDGPTALKRLKLRRPDIILLDVFMPGMDGFETCRQIRENQEWNHIPILFLSAADDKELIVRALAAGGVDYITKPFNHAELSMRLRTQLALKATHDRLQQLAEDKDELVGIVAHDIKNHLGGIQISAQLLKDRMASLGDARLTPLCENICQSGSQLLKFVREILAGAAAEHGAPSRPESVNLSDTVLEIVREYQEPARQKGLSIRASLAEADATVYADRQVLSQIFDNLISNAVKFSSPHTEISVSIHANGKLVECRVRDHGPGFTPKDKARLYGRYARLSARPTGGEFSTGLGLSIVKKLVDGMRGELVCDSVPGRGATFTVRLPRPDFLVLNGFIPGPAECELQAVGVS